MAGGQRIGLGYIVFQRWSATRLNGAGGYVGETGEAAGSAVRPVDAATEGTRLVAVFIGVVVEIRLRGCGGRTGIQGHGKGRGRRWKGSW